MMVRSLRCLLCAFALLSLSVEAGAQIGHPGVSQGGAFVGVGLGAGEVPVTFFDGCVSEDRYGAHSTSISAGVSVGVPIGPLVLQSQTTATTELVLGGQLDCFSMEPAHESGTHADRLRGVETGAFSATNLRLRYEVPTRFPVIASAGAGWVWTHALPFWSAGVGVRTPGRLRWGVDLSWNRYRVPFEVVTREWASFSMVRELSRETDHEWQNAWSVGLGAELHLR